MAVESERYYNLNNYNGDDFVTTRTVSTWMMTITMKARRRGASQTRPSMAYMLTKDAFAIIVYHLFTTALCVIYLYCTFQQAC